MSFSLFWSKQQTQLKHDYSFNIIINNCFFFISLNFFALFLFSSFNFVLLNLFFFFFFLFFFCPYSVFQISISSRSLPHSNFTHPHYTVFFLIQLFSIFISSSNGGLGAWKIDSGLFLVCIFFDFVIV